MNKQEKDAIKNTSILHGIAHSLVPIFQPHCRSIVMFGSAAYGNNFSTTSRSDLDLELIVDDFSRILVDSDLFSAPQKRLVSKMIDKYLDSDIDVLLYSFEYLGREVMLHLVEPKKFEKLTTIPVSTAKGDMSFSELRNYQKENLEYTNRCSFNDERQTWQARSTKIDEFFSIDLPYYQTKSDILYNGIFPEWHLSKPFLLYDEKQFFIKHENFLFGEFVKRKVTEEDIVNEPLVFTNILERKNRMNPKHLESINRRSNAISSKIRKKFNQDVFR